MTVELRQRPTLVRLCMWAIGYALRSWRVFIAVVFTRVAGVGLDLLKPWPMVILIDYALRAKVMPLRMMEWLEKLPGGANPMNVISLAVAGTVVLFVLSSIFGCLDGYAVLCLRQRMNYDLAGDVLLRLQQLSLQFHVRSAVAENMRRITADSACASTIVLEALLPASTSVLSLVATFVILWQIDGTLALMSLVVVPCMVVLVIRFRRPLQDGAHKLHRHQGKLNRLLEQSFSAIAMVQAFCREAVNVQSFQKASKDVMDATLARSQTVLLFTALLGCATAVSSAGILWVGGAKAIAGTITVGAILAFLSYMGSLYGPLERILQTSPTIHDAANRGNHLWEILLNEATVREKRGARKLHVPRGHIRFENVTFGYEAGRPVLSNIEFEALPGQTVALVGATGAGKTTLVSLLPRFFDPWEGAVVVDGQDVRDVQLKSLRGNIGFVLQDSFLFPLSIAENIAYGSPGATLKEIEEAARVANAHEFICRLSNGYDTVIGERGTTLSGGERQRIAIARALLKNAPILILDEPTSALDPETEKGFLQALGRLESRSTTFVIAHRLSTVRNADVILVLKDGRIAESGTHNELAARGGIYAELFQLQAVNKAGNGVLTG